LKVTSVGNVTELRNIEMHQTLNESSENHAKLEKNVSDLLNSAKKMSFHLLNALFVSINTFNFK